MPSLQSRIIIGLIKNRHLFKFRLKPQVVDEHFSVSEFRKEVDNATAKMKMPKQVTTQKEDIHSLYAEWIIPPDPLKGKMLLYIHGGGFISGSCQTHRMHVAKFALQSRLKSLVFDYRLAPEHPFPAAVEDCVTAYKWVLEQGYSSQDIVIGGESAGGTLTLSLLLALKELNIGLPKAAFSISPVTDLRCRADSFTYNARKDIAPQGSWDVWTRLYIGNNDPFLPLLSPQMGDFTGLPPLHICVGTHEIHYDDCIHVAQKAKEHGVEVTLSEWPGMVHAFPLLSPLFLEAKQAMGEICEFAQSQLNQENIT
ncbi:alpha/beta hydrolase fold domain-containing protein [candidate division KSB1 bacterium]|nr:alpha/beta hydrolase fold domain-containing protein [candidate division KSB1 bacterium]